MSQTVCLFWACHGRVETTLSEVNATADAYQSARETHQNKPRLMSTFPQNCFEFSLQNVAEKINKIPSSL